MWYLIIRVINMFLFFDKVFYLILKIYFKEIIGLVWMFSG